MTATAPTAHPRSGVPLEVGPAERVGPGRVEVLLDGRPVTFTSADTDLSPSPEVPAAAFSLLAALLDRPLVVAEGVDPTFARNVEVLGRTVERWWGCRPDPLPVARGSRRGVWSGLGRRRTALFFSCGLDSFHALLTARRPVDDLVFVHGFDVARGDEARAAALERRVRAVAAERGAAAVVVRTDIREHPTFRAVSWEQTHGGAMAAVGHLLRDRVGTLLIAASPSYGADRPWGSHWRIDRRWSSPGMRVVPVGMHRVRGEKVADLAGHPLLDAHLQVCWEREGEPGNCSTCRKCVLTMVMLEHHGGLASSSTFAPPAPLAELVDALPWSVLYAQSLAPAAEGTGDLARAVRAYLARGGDPAPVTSRRRRALDALRRP